MPSGLTRGWTPVRVKKTRQIKNLELRFDSIETEKALGEFARKTIGLTDPIHRSYAYVPVRFRSDPNRGCNFFTSSKARSGSVRGGFVVKAR